MITNQITPKRTHKAERKNTITAAIVLLFVFLAGFAAGMVVTIASYQAAMPGL